MDDKGKGDVKDEKEQSLHVSAEVTNPAGTIMEKSQKDIKFSGDKKAMTETTNIVGAEINEVQFTYVDGKKEP